MPSYSPADPLRILVVADGQETSRAVVESIGAEFTAGLRTSERTDQAATEAARHQAELVVLALPSFDEVERLALALQGQGDAALERPRLIALCRAADSGTAARLCRDGVIDDYVQHFPAPADADRLATSIRLAGRLAASHRAAPVGTSTARRRPVVLVVEDDEVLHPLVAAMLESEHLELVFEADGAAALERIQAVHPDLVLMDINLPGGDGVAITEQLKANPDLAAIPVVMLTGEARMDTLVRSMEAGAADFIVKPFTREALVAKLTKYLPLAA